MTYMDSYNQWLNDSAIDQATKDELRAIASDAKEIEDRFYTELEFGTAGMRGVIGAGKNRMNIYTVARATQGYANFINSNVGAATKGVTIAYDSRYMSEDFALEAALVLCANGIKVNLFEEMHSVPQLSFALQYYKSFGGIVITASHNPKQYNGYKVYSSNGAQIPPEIADKITAEILAISSFSTIKRMGENEAIKQGFLKFIGENVDKAYFDYTESLILRSDIVKAASDFKLVYTPLHGTGNKPVQRILSELGIKNVFVVKEQQQRDVEFSTVIAPNPESPDAFDLAIKLANEVGADLILATDPDADRLGVAVRDDESSFSILTGNQIGCLMMHYILMQKKQANLLSEKSFVVKSIVSTNMANAIAHSFDVQIDEVLTGFRFIGEKIAKAAQNDRQFIFGFEESYGFLAGTKVRDKDAVCGALIISEVAAYYSTRSMTLKDGLNELMVKYGHYCESIKAFTLYGKEGMEKIAGAMVGLREKAPVQFNGVKVTAIRDYKAGSRTDVDTGRAFRMDLPSSNVLYYELEDGSWVCIRPSGTEPKLKVYANGYEDSEQKSKDKLDAMIESAQEQLETWLK